MIHGVLFALLSITSCCHGFLVHPLPALKSRHNNTQPEQDFWCVAAAVVHFEQVYYQHPRSWMRRLVSSEPHRTWALENVTFSLESELVLLVGASSSGKSTALSLMSSLSSTGEPRRMAPTHGSVHVSTPPIYVDATKVSNTAVSVKNRHWTVGERLAPRPEFLQALSLAHCAEKTIDQLSLSELYKLTLAELCIAGANKNVAKQKSPILLIDEWLDNEPTSIVTAIEDALETFVATTNGIVCVVTHKRDRWKTQNRMELRQGKVVSRTFAKSTTS